MHGLNCVGLPSGQSKLASFCNVQEIKVVERNAATAYTAYVASIANTARIARADVLTGWRFEKALRS